MIDGETRGCSRRRDRCVAVIFEIGITDEDHTKSDGKDSYDETKFGNRLWQYPEK